MSPFVHMKIWCAYQFYQNSGVTPSLQLMKSHLEQSFDYCKLKMEKAHCCHVIVKRVS